MKKLTAFGRFVSSIATLAIASSVLALGIHSVMAAPTGNPPTGSVTPNFDGLNILNSGKVTLKNNGGDTRIELDGADGAIFLKDNTGASDTIKIDGNTSQFEVGGTGANMRINGDSGLMQLQDTGLSVTTAGTQKVALGHQGAAGGFLNIFSAWGITKPYIQMIADGTTSAIDIGGGALQNVGTLSNSSTASLGDVYIGDNVRVGSAYTLKADNITGATSDWVLAKNFFAESLSANTVTANNGIGRFYTRNSYGLNTINAGSSKTLYASCDSGDVVVSCGGLMDGTFPLDVDYRGAWPTGTTQCGAYFVNKKATSHNGSMGAYAYCFSPNG